MARKSGLGRGLGTLIPEGDSPDTPTPGIAAEGPFRIIPITSIIPNANQPRQHFDEEALASLASSIKSMGVLQPIMVRPVAGKEEFEIIAGERRWRASRIAGLDAIPAYVETDVNDTLSLERAIVENLHRVDLSALEEAAAYQQLIDDFALTHEQVADRVGKSRATITNTLRLLNLGPSAQKALKEGRISAGHARALLGLGDVAAQDRLVTKIVNTELTVRQVEDAVKAAQATTTPGKQTGTRPKLRPLPDPGIAELENLLEKLLSTDVNIEMKGKTGRLVINFADVDDLERIYNAMSPHAGA
ncbi:MAG: ParB/RepB/Spo0J family partition protein [Acidobacteria bacterium]|nr:ParB/RepB/Spo0J family partition protein [Acidobacteriota bacterium]